MPRTIDPALDGLMPNFHVADLDDLKYWYRQEAVDMARIFELSRETVREHYDMYDKILTNFQGSNASSEWNDNKLLTPDSGLLIICETGIERFKLNKAWKACYTIAQGKPEKRGQPWEKHQKNDSGL